MYGGVAKSYVTWEFEGAPFKDGKVYYVYAINPKTNTPKKVRFYTDKAHNDMMPKKENPYGKFCKLFMFENEQDSVVCIKGNMITEDEETNYFGYWNGWRFGMFFGGVWYAAKDTELPPIKNYNKFFKATWQEFQQSGQENSVKLGLLSKDESAWFREEE